MKSRIKKLREDAGLSQSVAAKKVGVATSTWQNWENGDIPKVAYGIKIGELFGVTLDYIYLGSEVGGTLSRLDNISEEEAMKIVEALDYMSGNYGEAYKAYKERLLEIWWEMPH